MPEYQTGRRQLRYYCGKFFREFATMKVNVNPVTPFMLSLLVFLTPQPAFAMDGNVLALGISYLINAPVPLLFSMIFMEGGFGKRLGCAFVAYILGYVFFFVCVFPIGESLGYSFKELVEYIGILSAVVVVAAVVFALFIGTRGGTKPPANPPAKKLGKTNNN